jgi:uncharacterized protein YbaP (TraB family)
MRRKIIFLLSALFGFFAPAIHAESNARENLVSQRGTLYRVMYQDNTAYLFGTIHVGRTAFRPLEGEAAHALAEAGKLVVEIDIGNTQPLQIALKKYGMYDAGDTIEKHLSPQNLKQLRQVLDKAGIPFKDVAHMKPWLITNLLLAFHLERNGYQQNDGTEVFLLAFARKHAKTIQELETADYQLSLFDTMTEAEQERYLAENLEEISDGSALKKAHELVDAWNRADGRALDALLDELRNDKTLSSEFMKRVLLDKRNLEMTAAIETLLKNDKSTFIGVGLLHLLGEQGIPQLLQQRGYKVQKLY